MGTLKLEITYRTKQERYERKKEIEKVKQIIKENIKDIRFGIFDTTNLVKDFVVNKFDGKYISVGICPGCCYFEILGATQKEFAELESYYHKLGGI